MEYIFLGIDDTITSASDGTTNKTGIGGFGSRYTDYSVDDMKTEAAASATAAGELGCSASVFEDFMFITNRDGPVQDQDIEITIDGFYSALLDSVAGGSRVRLTAFARTSDSVHEEEIVDKVSNTFDYWSNNDDFSVTLDFNAQVNESYEIGVKARASASALSTAAAHADIADSGGIIEYTGRIRYDSIRIKWP